MKVFIAIIIFYLISDFAESIKVPVEWRDAVKIDNEPIILKSEIVNQPAPKISIISDDQNEWLPISYPNSINNQQQIPSSSYTNSYMQQLQQLNIRPEEIHALQKKYLGTSEKYIGKLKKEEEAKKIAAHKLHLIKSGKLKPSVNKNILPQFYNINQIPNAYNHQPEYIPASQENVKQVLKSNYKNHKPHVLQRDRFTVEDNKPVNSILPQQAFGQPHVSNNYNLVTLPGTSTSSKIQNIRGSYSPGTQQKIQQVLSTNYKDDRTHEPDALDPFHEAITLAKGGKEYREDKIHEPKDNKDTESLDYNNSEPTEENNSEDTDLGNSDQEETPKSEFEVGREVPTRPIYPGPGKWAKPGIKNRPYIYRPIELPPQAENVEEDEKKPEGHDIFEELQTYFNRQRDTFDQGLQQTSQAAKKTVAHTPAAPWTDNGFQQTLNSFLSHPVQQAPTTQASIVFNPFDNLHSIPSPTQVTVLTSPQNHQPVLYYSPAVQNPIRYQQPTKTNPYVPYKAQTTQQKETKTEDAVEEPVEESDNEEEIDQDEEFVPSRLYTQVRKTEEEEHLPSDISDSRLREVIKDSKIQTVYSEEGYEDSAYDHEGEEKHAEHDEGEAEHEKEEVVKKPTSNKKNSKQSYSQDSDSEGSQVVPTKTTLNAVEEPVQMKQNNFIETKETKTTAVKNKGDGKVEMEIQSEVKVISQPNNSTKAHKYVKIFPKITKNIDINKENGEQIKTKPNFTESLENSMKPSSINSNSSITLQNKTEKSINNKTKGNISSSFNENQSKNFTNLNKNENLKYNQTTSPFLSKFVFKSSASENEPLEKIDVDFARFGKKRTKRFVNDFPNVEADTKFIDKINHTLAPAKIIDKTKTKYPYYKRKDIHENSPLRYVEDLKNIPLKIEGELSFYRQADKHGCPEIPDKIDPIPKRVKTAKEGVEKPETEDEATPKTPRLENLGDKIDCLKVRYFGDNPLDSPFFKEDSVGPVKPIFAGLEGASSNKNIAMVAPKKKMEDSMVDESQIMNDSVENNEIITTFKENQTEINNKSTSQIITQDIAQHRTTEPQKVKKRIQYKDQDLAVNILSDVIGHIKNIDSESSTTSSKQLSQSVISTTLEPIVSFLTTPRYTTDLKPRHIYDQIELLNHLPKNNEGPTSRSDQGDEIYYTDNPSSQIPNIRREGRILVEPSSETLPNNEALRRRRIGSRRPIYHQYNNLIRYNIPPSTTGTPIINTQSSTVLPKYKVVSEVFYKDEIKPNEQLNVFADVLNTIKNSPTEKSTRTKYQSKVSADFALPQIQKTRVKKFQEDSSYNLNSLNAPFLKNVQTTEKYFQPTIPNDILSTTPNDFQNNTPRIRKIHRKRKPTKTSSLPTTSTTIRTTSTTSSIPVDIIDESMHILGLVPPGSWEYKTIVEPEKTLEEAVIEPVDQEPQQQVRDEAIVLNKYIVPGMKPPLADEPYIYSDFLAGDTSILRKRNIGNGLKRSRRSANRPSYSEFSRNRGKQNADLETTTVKVEDDDYVPHRPKNYYYDEKIGKIVYLNKPKETEEEEEEVEYVEVVETPTHPTKEKVTTKPLLATATPPPAGKSFIDFVAKLKNNENYKFIPDPTTTEKGEVVATSQQVSNKVSTEPTAPPEFLNILAKVKTDGSYKEIKDPEEEKKSKRKTTTTEIPEIEEEEEEDEEPQANVQNSRGGQASLRDDSLSNLNIFDISDFLPKIKNYTPRTTIDYSKYKTIERPSTRHNLSSRYNVDENENIDEVVTVRKPIILEQKESTTEDDRSIEEKTPALIIRASPTENLPTLGTTSASKRRRRPVTLRSNSRTTDSYNETPHTESSHRVEQQVLPNHEKAKRVYRRRPVRIRSTTAKYVDENEDTTKILRKRSDTESSIITSELSEDDNVEDILEEPQSDIPESNKKELTSKKPADIVIIIKEYDKTKKHGGNYRKDPDLVESSDKEELQENPVVVFKKFDKTKKHGGNYKNQPEKEETEGAQNEGEKIALDIYQKGSIKDNTEIPENKSESSSPAFRKYRKIKKQSTNRNMQIRRKLNDASSAESIAEYPEETYIKNNILRRNFNVLDRKEQNSENKEPELNHTKNKTKRRRKIRPKANFNRSNSKNIIPLTKLSDVVQKPEGYYTDAKLPIQVNELRHTKISSAEVQDIVDHVEKEHNTERARNIVKSVPVSKKPIFIKDPGKRLYFYAPV